MKWARSFVMPPIMGWASPNWLPKITYGAPWDLDARRQALTWRADAMLSSSVDGYNGLGVQLLSFRLHRFPGQRSLHTIHVRSRPYYFVPHCRKIETSRSHFQIREQKNFFNVL